MLVFLCCSTPRDEALRLSLLGGVVSQLEERAVAQAEVRAWREAMSALISSRAVTEPGT